MTIESQKSPELDTVVRFGMPHYMLRWYQRTQTALCSIPPPASLLTLTNSGGDKQNWFKVFSDITLGGLAESLIACSYHAHNLLDLEKELVRTAEILYPDRYPFRMVIGRGNDCKIMIEYHAYASAYRRGYDFLGKVVGAYFQQEISSITDFQSPSLQQQIRESARGNEMPDVADEVLKYITFLFEHDINIFSPEQQRFERDVPTLWENVFGRTLSVLNTSLGWEIGFINDDVELESLYQDYQMFMGRGVMFHLGQQLLNRCGIFALHIEDAYVRMGVLHR